MYMQLALLLKLGAEIKVFINSPSRTILTGPQRCKAAVPTAALTENFIEYLAGG